MNLRKVLSIIALVLVAPALFAADHGDAPNASIERSADIADVYTFMDPTDNTRVIVAMTVSGFIVPGENFNFGFFDPRVRYSLGIENTGDARLDRFIDVRFSTREANGGQTATIKLPDGRTFTAPTTLPSATADTSPAPVITTDPTSSVRFFAGLVDDPFFFDIPGFLRFVASVRAGAPDGTLLSRGRDSFAGYNALAIAFSIPASQLRGSNGTKIGVHGLTQRRQNIKLTGTTYSESGRFVNIDRMAIPAVNVALIPFVKKNSYNVGSTTRDASGEFAGDIIGTLTALGTNQTNINILATVAVLNGDILRLDTGVANSGPGSGTNAGAGFPNGRRLADDVIDTILFFVANQNALGDSVNANDVPFRDAFPFFAPSQQPRTNGILDDNTRN